MSIPGPQRVAVRRLRVRDGRADAVTARRRTERALAAVELSPRALPPGAILLVRSLRARVGDAPAALAELLRTAARPAREAVPASAAAVFFASRAELLACLATDWCAGVDHTRWWWAGVVRDDDRGPAGAWEDTPEAVAAAFSILASRRRAVEFAARIDDAQATRMTYAVAHVHGVSVPTDDREPKSNGRASTTAIIARAVPRTATPSDPAPEARAPELSLPQQRLLRLALTLARAPAELRAAPEVRAPTTPAPEAAALAAPERAKPARAEPRRSDGRAVKKRELDSPRTLDAHPPDAREVTPQPDAQTTTPRTRHTRETAPAANVEPTTVDSGPPPAPDSGASKRSAVPAPPDLPAPDSDEPYESATPDATPLARRRVETAIGGLLFLVVVAQRLGLYADFTEPAAPNLPIDPWRVVARVGAHLLESDEHNDDALWTLLDELTRDDDELAPHELEAHIAVIRRWLESHVDLPLRHVFELPALVYADETRVDAVFSLASHPIEIRIAGLDIDPGWIPAAGRALHFHFE